MRFIGGAVLLAVVALSMPVYTQAEESNDNLSPAQLLAQRDAQRALEQSLLGDIQQQMQRQEQESKTNQVILAQLRQAAPLSDVELKQLGADELYRYQQLQANVQNTITELDAAEQENQRLRALMQQLTAKNMELSQVIDTMRPDILQLALKAEHDAAQAVGASAAQPKQ